LGHKVTFFASGNKAAMKWINNGNVDEFTNYVNGQIGKKDSSSILPQVEDIPNQIKKLSELKDLGILTEEEFNQKKTELLRKM
jgi:hypothetical protein